VLLLFPLMDMYMLLKSMISFELAGSHVEFLPVFLLVWRMKLIRVS
jgi:hypothetical protein